MLGATSPTLLGISLDMELCGMTPRQLPTYSAYDEYEITTTSHMIVLTESSS